MLKVMSILATLLAKGSARGRLACKQLLPAIEDVSMSFFAVDAEHGAKPAEMIRASAAKNLLLMQVGLSAAL